MKNLSYILPLLLLFCCVAKSQAQYSVTICKTQDDALIATDRNQWAHDNLAVVNEGYLNNFEQPEPPCGIENLSLQSVEITVELINYTTTAECSNVPVFGNILVNCPLTTTSVCGIEADMLAAGCGNYAGTTNLGTYTLSLGDCGIFISATDVIGVDLVPATENGAPCPIMNNAITSGVLELEYEICIEYIYNQDVPAACDNTISLPCDDGNPCTSNDQELVDECDNSIICVPCQGTLQGTCDDTVTLPCNDGNDCTINDQVIVSACDEDFICEPCAGILQSDCDNTITLPCDDSDPCTINDVQIVSSCDETFICEPCAGVQAESCEVTISLPCDDGNPCTENDTVIVDACNNDIICEPCNGVPVIPLDCDDGDCTNGIEFWDDASCSCQTTSEEILGCTDPTACDFNPEATCDNGCDYSCLDCMGVIDGEAIIDICGECLMPDDPLLNSSCFNQIYIPNAFTPDNDGLNDVFKIGFSRPLEAFEIRIYNRIGEEIFYSTDPHFAWVGNVNNGDYYAQPGIYAYQITYSYDLPLTQKLTGSISLVR